MLFLYFSPTYCGQCFCLYVQCPEMLLANILKCIRQIFGRPYSVVPLSQHVVCRLSVCDVLYCGETVRLSKKLSEGAVALYAGYGYYLDG